MSVIANFSRGAARCVAGKLKETMAFFVKVVYNKSDNCLRGFMFGGISMICIKCGAKIPDESEAAFCPECKAPLNNNPSVSDDTKVDWKDSFADTAGKTMILPDFGEGTPLPGGSPGEKKHAASGAAADTTMRTNPQMEFSPEDFKKFDHFDIYGSDPYGIEMPGQPVTTEKHAGIGGDRTVVLENSEAYRSGPGAGERTGEYGGDRENLDSDGGYGSGREVLDSAGGYGGRRESPESRRRHDAPIRPAKEKYFPNGFLQEHPDVERPRRKHRIGALDILILLLGTAMVGLCAMIFKTSDGLTLIRQFFAGDMNLLLDNMNDITYFSHNLDVTWRLYYEAAAIVIITVIVAVALIVLHSFVKKQGLGILKAVVLLITGVGMAVLGAGYCAYYLLTVRNTAAALGGGSLGLVTIAGVGVAVAAVLWFIYMCIWGFTSFFKDFHVASMALLALGFVFAFLLMAFNLFASYKVCHNIMPADAMYEIMSTPAMIALFMVLSLLASLEDYMAKRDIEE